jgi:acetyltransferase-like isoleucine patch superfamily enzyme
MISDDFVHGKNFEHGENCVIEPDVVVGNNVTLGHNVILKSGTILGNNVIFGDKSCTTGICYVGNYVNVRTGACISKGVIVEDYAFIGGNVMTSHTKNVHHHRPGMEKRQYITRIGVGAVIGSGTNVMAGVVIGSNVVVGYGSNIVSDLLKTGIYFGNPARYQGDIASEMCVNEAVGWFPFVFQKDRIKKYLPHFQFKD